VKFSYDPAKNNINIAERGISFEHAADFEWASALVVEDLRKDYGEPRFQAVGLIGVRIHVLVFTPRAGSVHVISLRKANRREVIRYESKKNAPS